MVRIALFLAFLLIAVVYSLWRGGGPERAMAAIALTMVGADQLLHSLVPPEYAALDLGHLAIDLFGAAATFMLALFAHRFWPMCVAVLHILPLLAHTSRMIDVTMQPAIYLTMQVATSWPVPLILILATWRHRRRLVRGESEPSWLISSPRSIRRTSTR
ncbi:hypothetical protein GGC65_002347 [Sphingopyxis sp. OAS728]|uniref:hypothetical protein n=1 Tax=Sphingopyxis sp. OAS728 TaxID=2663823 RepID=UPI001789ACD0|nr:hypothetical protein [Sphingopyxis sp. OAS728]MBE1527891.1 hypothetical protein [Sphingopyxis sp. OAS728]